MCIRDSPERPRNGGRRAGMRRGAAAAGGGCMTTENKNAGEMCIRDSFGDFDAVADEVVAASIQTGKQAVPVLSLIHI